MSFRKFVVLVSLSLLGAVGRLHAQAGVYVGFSATDFSGITCLAVAGCSNGTPTLQQGSVKPTGLLLGGYYDFKTFGKIRVGADVRYNHDGANKSAADGAGGENSMSAQTVLGGVRGSYVFGQHYRWLRPYAQMSLGRTSSNVTEPSCVTTSGTGGTLLCSGLSSNTPRKMDSFFRYEAFAGADIRIFSILDLRLVEVGIGNMNRIGSGTSGTSSSVGVKSIGAGVVFHLP